MKDDTQKAENEVIKQAVKSIIKEIKENEDPAELDRYKKLLKGSSSIFIRSYIAAYLLKQVTQGKGIRLSQPNKKRTSRPKTTPKDQKTIFISIGRTRRVYPKDLTRMFCEVDGITPSDIGTVRVLDNYSFIDINEKYAQKAVDQLNGNEYKGRKITVNFAREK